MDSLADDLLVEIFCRLPCAEAVITCKCVCKQWLSLISKPQLVARFIAHNLNNGHINSNNKKKHRNEELSSFTYIDQGENEDGNIFFFPTSPVFTSLDTTLDFIPSYENTAKSPVKIRSKCSDLILCSRLPPEEFSSRVLPEEPDLYICNPRSKQWIQLPTPSHKEHHCLTCFTCDPYYETGSSISLSTCRYSVCYGFVVSRSSSRVNQLEMKILSSETGVWKKAVLLSPKFVNFWSAKFRDCFTYNGMVHFCTDDGIIGFDTYNVSADGFIHGRVIQLPLHDGSNQCGGEYVGVSGGKIVLLVYCRCLMSQQQQQQQQQPQPDNTDVYSLRVWELKGYETGEWLMTRIVHLNDLVVEDSEIFESLVRRYRWNLLMIHPNDADVLLLILGERMVECNLREKTWKSICSIPSSRKRLGLVFPWWPTPLKQLPW
ncbi:hypothetical protein SOVF_148680 [Spinacia oleracea]|uniref:F-box domain-containing protein n=1 Tax=Spinacia oleracea TaxID=3562 RepID=A0A9R0IQX1_SPIOL|nr:uncharacterized protein LOC110793029 [Spinacia oleracea]XP_056687126.1 uncharacterized protein LOC110793029 [Spinacia oleracea]XP_056687127.1 uncharacterized protein LOC110793029 [Spinacia oleracea]KNA09978.1 hypothetical protein SOVF_148680 [Spinacia oleracea]